MSDMKAAIVPKSDQLNADDLIAGEITVKITGVNIKGGQEQPVSIHYEGDKGKPYKPCKSMCRVMVQCWGPDSKQYVGRSMTLYRDPDVKWGAMAVGGIRISHMTNIEESRTMPLTATKGSKKLFTVKPLSVKNAAPPPAESEPGTSSGPVAEGAAPDDAPRISDAQKKRLEARITEVGAKRDDVKAYVKKTFGKDHFHEMSQDEYDKLDAMLDRKAAKAAPKGDDGGIIGMDDDLPFKASAI